MRIRDETETSFRDDYASFELFDDVASLNEHLDDGERTADLFAEVLSLDADAAAKLYHVAESPLIATGRFRDCGPFLDPPQRLHLAAESYREMKKYDDSEPDSPQCARGLFVNDMATLVALLVLNDRPGEARDCYKHSLKTVDDDKFRKLLDAAMKGKLPESNPCIFSAWPHVRRAIAWLLVAVPLYAIGLHPSSPRPVVIVALLVGAYVMIFKCIFTFVLAASAHEANLKAQEMRDEIQ